MAILQYLFACKRMQYCVWHCRNARPAIWTARRKWVYLARRGMDWASREASGCMLDTFAHGG
jgi:hypothetical protein